MRVISRKCLTELAKRHPDAKPALEAWFHEAQGADWASPAQVKQQYATASILKHGRVVFNICGNKYRLVVKINYSYRVVTSGSLEHTPTMIALTVRRFNESQGN